MLSVEIALKNNHYYYVTLFPCDLNIYMWSILVMLVGCLFLVTVIKGSKLTVLVCCVLEQGT